MAERISVTLNGRVLSCEAGTRLSALLPAAGGRPLPCGGHGHCGKCRVTAEGALTPPTAAERRHLTEAELAAGVRLACQAAALGDCTVSFGDADTMRAQILTGGALPPLTLAPRFGADGCGAAVDVGTTTLAARLYDAAGRLLAEASRLNPQSAWGADVVSRMEAALAGQAGALAASIRGAVDGLLAELSAKAGTGAPQAVVVTGNTVMLHLLTETDVEPLTHAPFAAARLFGETLPARALSLASLDPETPVFLPPCIASFVGADTVTAMLAAGFGEADDTETRLLCDIGTNGETVLSHRGRLYACSTAAGPAFEGAGISMGMGGLPGAIDRVRVAPDGTLDAHVIGGAAPVGICGSGLIDAVAALLETEALDETGYLEDDPTPILPPVSLTQADIRAVQLAKSAIHAGLRTLLSAAGAPIGEVRALLVAGGFGSYLDVRAGARIGLLPQELADRVRVLGNAALAGASMLLLSRPLEAVCRTLAHRTEHVSLAANPVFSEEYMERMLF